MQNSTVTEIAQHIADVAETDGGEILDIGIAEMGDGSGRTFARVVMFASGLEQEYRIISPAPWNSPEWASIYRDWRYELRTGETWLDLTPETESATTREP